MDFLCHFSKVGLLAPALVIEIVIPSFFPCPPPTHTPQHTATSHTFPMPPKATKNWGQADRDLLADLTNRQLIDITDTTHQNIEQVRDLHFRHRHRGGGFGYYQERRWGAASAEEGAAATSRRLTRRSRRRTTYSGARAAVVRQRRRRLRRRGKDGGGKEEGGWSRDSLNPQRHTD